MAKASIEFVGEERVSQLIDKMNRKIDELTAANRKLADETKRTHEESSSAMEKGLDKIEKLGASYLTARKALQLLNAEVERQIDLNRKALEAQQKVANPERTYLTNFQPTNPQQSANAIRELSNQVRIDLPTVYGALNESRKQSATLSESQHLDALKEAARWTPQSEAALGGTAGGIAQLMSTGMSADEAAQMLARMAAQSGAGMEGARDRLLPAFLKGRTFGKNTNFQTALLDALTSEGGFTGERGPRQAAQTFENLELKLTESYPTKPLFKPDERGRLRRIAAGTGRSDAPEDIIAYLQNNPSEAEKFISKSQFNADEIGAVRDLLLSPNSSLSQRVQANYQQNIAGKRIDPSIYDKAGQQIAGTITRRTEQQTTESDLLKPYGAGQHAAFEQYQKFLNATNAGWLTKSLAEFGYYAVPGNGPDYVSARIQHRLESIDTGDSLFNPTHRSDYPGQDLEALRVLLQAQLETLRLIKENQNHPVTPNQHNE